MTVSAPPLSAPPGDADVAIGSQVLPAARRRPISTMQASGASVSLREPAPPPAQPTEQDVPDQLPAEDTDCLLYASSKVLDLPTRDREGSYASSKGLDQPTNRRASYKSSKSSSNSIFGVGKIYSSSVTSMNSFARKSNKLVRFASSDGGEEDRGRPTARSKYKATMKCCTRWLLRIGPCWSGRFRNFVVMCSLYEVWSFGIWMAFIIQKEMVPTLLYILLVDAILNNVFLADKVMELTMLVMVGSSVNPSRRERRTEKREAKRKEEAMPMRINEENDDEAGAMQKIRQAARPAKKAQRSMELARIRNCLIQAFLAISMYPVQLILLYMMWAEFYPPIRVLIVLCVRAVRVGWAALDGINYVNQKEIDVYVDIKIQGANSSSGGGMSIISKQFVIVMYFGHLAGCLTYAMSVWTFIVENEGIDTSTRGMPRNASGARDYFDKFSQEGMVLGYVPGEGFWTTYCMALYRGFAWNFEDLVPERTEELIMELVVSIGIVIMKSYCIGSFFKYYQKREEELQEFDEVMQGVSAYMDLCDLPHSIRRATKQHFMYQQEKRQELQIAKVLSCLPIEAQNKLKEFEFQPIIRDRNPLIFGQQLSNEFISQLCDLLERRYEQPGEVLFLEGDCPRELFFLEHGSVSLSKLHAGKGNRMSEQIMATYRADRKEDPTVIGELSFVLNQAHWHSARVRPGMEAIVLVLTRRNFDVGLMSEYPEQLDIVLRNIAEANELNAQGECDVDMMHSDVKRLLERREETLHAECFFAAGAGDAKLLKQMLDKRLDVNMSDYDKRSAMHIAASECHMETLEVLIAARAEVNVKDRWGSTPLQDALRNGFMGGAKLLYRNNAELGLDDPSGVLCNYASEGNTTKMQELLDFGVDINAGDYDDRTAMHLSASEGKLPVVAYLACCKANVNVLDRWKASPLEDAIRGGFHVVARFLRTQNGKIDSEFAANTLCEASASGSLAQLNMLVESGLDVDVGDYDRRTAAHLAAAEGQILALDYLLNVAHANPSPRDRWTATPLQDALAGGHDLCAKLLLASGAELGENATKEHIDAVNQVKKTWFSDEKHFSEEVSQMRHKISTRKTLVNHGAARADIFDLDGAIRFTRKLMNSQITCLPSMCRDADWVCSLLKRLDTEGIQPLLCAVRMVDNASDLEKEAKRLARVAQDIKRQEKSKREVAKDSQSGIFTKVHFGTLNSGSTLEDVMEVFSSRLLRRVDALYASRADGTRQNSPRGSKIALRTSQLEAVKGEGRANQRASFARAVSVRGPQEELRLSEVVVDEMFAALGWDGESDVTSRDGNNADLLGLKGLDDDNSQLRRLMAERLELLAGELLAGQHMLYVLQQDILCEVRKMKTLLANPPRRSSEASERDTLAQWINDRSHTVLSGQDLPGEGPPPCTLPWHETFAPLWPTPMGTCDQDSLDVDKHRRLVAAELAMLVVTALVMDGWDKARQRSMEIGRKTKDKRDNPINNTKANCVLSQDAFIELGRVVHQASRYCTSVLQTRLTTKTADDEVSECDELHLQPVDVASILGTNSAMDPDRLALLLNFANVPPPPESKKSSSLFGLLSPSAFAFDLLSSMLNHDEVQKGIFTSLAEAEREKAIADMHPHCDTSIVTAREELSCGRLVVIYSDDLELYDIVSSAAGSDLSDETISDFAEAKLTRKGMTGSGVTEDTLDAGLEPTTSVAAMKSNLSTKYSSLRSKINAFVGYFGQEGHSRRRSKRIAKVFGELDEDGEGVGVTEVAKILATAFNHTLGQEQELRGAHRIFELLEKGDEVGELIKLPELLKALPMLEEEMMEQQRKRRRTAADSEHAGMWRLTKVLAFGVVTPDAHWLRHWDRLKRIVAVYYMLEVPIRFSFISMDHLGEYEENGIWVANVCADSFMAANTILNFFRSYVHPTRGFVTNFQEIRIHYLLNFFFVDLLACCPLDYMLSVRSSGNFRGPLARPRALARLVRLLHLRQILLYDSLSLVTEAERSRKNVNKGFIRTAWFLVLLMCALIHFSACIWWFVGGRSPDFNPVLGKDVGAGLANHSSWIYGYEERPNETMFGDELGLTPFWWQYLISFYWNAGRITSIGTVGEMFPGSMLEVVWACLLFVLSLAVGGYVDGILAGKVTSRNDSTIEEKATSRMIEVFLQATDIPDQLAHQIRACASAINTAQKSQRAEEVSRSLPFPLRQRISSRAFMPMLAETDIFKNCSHNFLVEVGVICRFIMAAKDSTLIYSGEPCTRMLTLISGRIVSTEESGNEIFRTSVQGTVIGDVPLLFDAKHQFGITTAQESKLLCLQRDDFNPLCKQFPQERMVMRRTIIKILEGGGEMRGTSEKGTSIKKGKSKSTLGLATSEHSSTGASSNNSASVLGAMQRSYSRELPEMRRILQADEEQMKQQQIAYFIGLAAEGDAERLEEALNGVDLMVDEGDYDQRTALHLASCNGHLATVKCLVERYGASLLSKDRFGHTPMDDAVREHKTDIIHYLSERGALYRVDSDIAGAMCAAAYENDVERIKIWVHVVGVDPNIGDYDFRTPLHLAASEGHAEVVKLLLAVKGINVSPRDRLGNTPLDDAIRHRRTEVRILLQQKSAKMGDANVGVTLCTLAALNDCDRLKELQMSGLPMHLGDYDARTALHLAASEGKLEATAYLLNEANVPPNALDRFLCTPLDDAKRHGHNAIVALLSERNGYCGNDPHLKDDVEQFVSWQEGDKKRKDEVKLEKELSKTGVHQLTKAFRRFSDNPTLEEDVATYITSAATFRKLLMNLLAKKAMTGDDEHDEKEHIETTKQHMERLLNQAAIALDAAASRLGTFMSAEMMPWMAALSEEENRLLRIFMPGLCSVIPRLREQLKTSTAIIGATRKLWVESTRDQGSYECRPLGLLAHRFGNVTSVEAQGPRMDALMSLWHSHAPSTSASIMEVEREAQEDDAESLEGNGERHSQAERAEGEDASKEVKRPERLRESLAMSFLVGSHEHAEQWQDAKRKAIPHSLAKVSI